MMDQQKKKALIEWINSVAAGPCVESLEQLRDGSILCKLVHLIDVDIAIVDEALDEEKLGIVTTFLEDRFKSNLSDKVNLCTVIAGNEYEIAKLCLLVMGASLMSGNNEIFVERAQKMEPILQYEVKEMVEWLLPFNENTTNEAGLNCSFFQVLSQSLQLTAEQMAHPQMSSTPHCNTGVVASETPSNNFNTTPGRSTFKGTPLVFSTSMQNSNNSILGRFMSPKHGGGTPLMPMSPIQQLVHSPGVASKIMMQQKEMQIRRLQRELNAEKHLKMELEGEVQEQKKSVEKKEQQISTLQKQLSKYRRQTLTLQEDVERMEGVAEKNQNLEQEIMRKQCLTSQNRNLRESCTQFERDNGDLLAEIQSLQSKLAQLKKVQESSQELQTAYDELKVSFAELQASSETNRLEEQKLHEENAVLRVDLLKIKEDYHAKCEELRMRKDPSFSDLAGENMGEVMETHYQEDVEQLQNELDKQMESANHLKEQLTSVQNHSESLSNELAVTKTRCDNLQFDMSSAVEKNENMTEIIQQGEAKQAALSSEGQKLKNHCHSLEQEVSNLKNESSQLQADCSQLAKSLKNERDNTSVLEGKIQKYETIRDKLNSEIEKRDIEKKDLEQQNHTLREEYTGIKILCTEAQEEVLTWKQAWEAVNQKLADSSVVVTEYQKRIECSDQQLEDLKIEVLDLKKNVTEKETQCTVWQNMARGFETQSKELDQKIKISTQIAEQKEKDLQDELIESKKQINKVQSEFEISNEKLIQIQKQIETREESMSVEFKNLKYELESVNNHQLNVVAQNQELDKKCAKQQSLIQQQQEAGMLLEQEQHKLISERTELNDTIQRSKEMISSLERSLKDGQDISSQKDVEIMELKASCTESQSQYEILCKRIEATTDSHQVFEASLKDEINILTAEVDTAKSQVSEANKQCETFQEIIKEKDAKFQEIEQDLYIWQDKYAQLDGTHFTLEQRTNKLVEENNSIKAEKENLNVQIANFESNKLDLQEHINSLKRELCDENEQTRKLKSEIQMLVDEKSALSCEGKGMHDFLEKLKAEKFNLESELFKTKQDFQNAEVNFSNGEQTLQKEVQNNATEISNLKSELESSIHLCSELKEQVEKGEMALKEAEQNVMSLEEKCVHLSNTKISLEQNIQIIQEESNERLSEVAKLSASITSIKAQLSSEEEKFEEVQKLNLELKSKNEELSQCLNTTAETSNTLMKQLQETQLMFSDAQVKYDLSENAVTQYEKRCMDIKAENAVLVDNVSDLEKKLMDERLKTEDKNTAASKADTSIKEMKTLMENLQKQYADDRIEFEKEKSVYVEKVQSLEMNIIEGQKTLDETEEQCRSDLNMYENKYNEVEKLLSEQKQAVIHLTEELSNTQRELKCQANIQEGKMRTLQEDYLKMKSQLNTTDANLNAAEAKNNELKYICDSHEIRVKQLNHECEVVKAEKLCAEQSMKSWQEKARDYEMKQAEAEEQIYLSKENTDSKITEIQSEMLKAREKNSLLESTVNNFTSKMSLVEIELKEKQQAYEKDQEIIGLLKSELSELEGKHKSLLSENDLKQITLKSELDTYKEKMSVTEKNVEDYFEKVCLLEKALRAQKCENEKLQMQVTELSSSKYSAVDKVENLEEQLRREEQKYANLENDFSEAETVNACLEDKLQAYENKMQDMESVLNLTQVEKNTVEESFKVELHSAQNKQHELQKELEEAVNEFKKTLVGLEEQVKKMDSEVITTKSNNRELIEKLSITEKERNSLKQDIELEKRRCLSLEQELEKWNKKWNDVEHFVDTQQDRACNMEDKLAISRKEVQALEAKLSAAESRAAKLEEDLKITLQQVEQVKENTLLEVKEARNGEADAESALEDAQSKYAQLEEQCDTLRKKYGEAKGLFSKLHERCQNAEKDSKKFKTSFDELHVKYEKLKVFAQKHKDLCDETEKREEQYNEVINKYKSNQEVKNSEITKLTQELQQANSKVEMYEQKCQELDVEVSALRQESRQEEQMHKKLSTEVRSLEAQIDFANRELRGRSQVSNATNGPRKVLSTRELPTTAHLVMKKESTSEDEASDEGKMYLLRTRKSVAGVQSLKAPLKTPSMPNLRKTSSTFSVTSCTKSEAPYDHIMASPTESLFSQDSIDSYSERRRSRRLTEFGRSTTSASFEPLRSNDVPRGLGALLSSEDEPEQLDAFGRLSELQRRNTLCLPHMKSSYPVETQVHSKAKITDTTLKLGDVVQQTAEELGLEKRITRKRTSVDHKMMNESFENVPKKKLKEDVDADGIYVLHTPGVKLYRRYSPRIAKQIKLTPSSRRFDTSNLNAALDEASTASPVHRARKNTPRRTPNSVRRRWGRRKEYSTSEENDPSTKKKTLKESLAYNIGFTPEKRSKKLRNIIGKKKDPQVKKKPLGDNNHTKSNHHSNAGF